MSTTLGAPFSRHVPSVGHAILNGNAVLTNASPGPTTLVEAPGPTGNTPTGAWCDIYGVCITSSDASEQTVTISDGTTSVEYIVAAPSPICDDVIVPYRFAQGATLKATAGGVTSGKTISVIVRGVASWT